MRLLLHIEADWSPCDSVGELAPVARFLVDESTVWHEYIYCPDCGKVWAKCILLCPTGLPDGSRFAYTPTRCQGSILGTALRERILYSASSLNRQQMELLIHDYLSPFTDLAASNSGDLAAAFRYAGQPNPYFRAASR